MKNVDIANRIISSGMDYIRDVVNAQGFVVKDYKIRKYIHDYYRGRTYYTNSQIEQLKKLFNKTHIKSVSYDVRSVKSNRIVSGKTGEVYDTPVYNNITIGTMSESEKTRARNLSKAINKLMSHIDEWSDETKDAVSWNYDVLPARLKRPANELFEKKGIIKEDSVTGSDLQTLLDFYSGLMENTELSKKTDEELDEYIENAIDPRVLPVLKNGFREDVYQAFKTFKNFVVVDSYEKRLVSISFYEDGRDMVPEDLLESLKTSKSANEFLFNMQKLLDKKLESLGRKI